MMSSTGNKRKQSVFSEEEKDVERVENAITTSHNSSGKEIDLKMLQDALDSIPDKQAYVEAKKRGLVEMESDPVSFLKSEAWNAPAAAKRLVAYWEERQCLFGPLVCSLNLKLITDQGPFNDGVLVMIPDEKNNRAVLCIDESRRKHVYGKGARLQCAFYLLSQLVAIEQQVEVTILLVLRSVSFEFSGATDLIRLIREAFPIRFQAMHIACLADNQSLLQETVLPSLLGTLGRFPKLIPKVHIGENKDDLLRQLKAAHFVENLLPETIGGSWEYTRFAEWQKERLSIEKDSKLPPRKRSKVSASIEDALMKQDPRRADDMSMKQDDTSDNATLPHDLAGTQSSARAGLDAPVPLPETKEASEHGSTSDKGSCDPQDDYKHLRDDARRPAVADASEDELDKKARADISVASSTITDVPSNSDKKQVPVKSLQHDDTKRPAVADASEDELLDKKARGDYSMTSSTITDVPSHSDKKQAPVAAAASQDDEEAKAAMLRKRNAIYSKRKYYKKKYEVERLEQSRYELETTNHKLRVQNRRLETILADAQEKVALQESMEALAATRQSSTLPLPLLSQIQSLRNMDPSLVSSLAQLAPGGCMPQPASSGLTRTTTGMLQSDADKQRSAPAPPEGSSLLNHHQALLRSLLEQGQEDSLQREFRERAEALQRSSERKQLVRDLIASLASGATTTTPNNAGNNMLLDPPPLQGMNASDVAAAILAQQQQQRQQQQQPLPPLSSNNSMEAAQQQLSLLLSGANQTQPMSFAAAELLAAVNNSLSSSSSSLLQNHPLGRNNFASAQQPQQPPHPGGGGGGRSSNRALLEFLARSRQPGGGGNPK